MSRLPPLNCLTFRTGVSVRAVVKCQCQESASVAGDCSDVTVGSLSGLQCITENRRMQTVVLNEDVLLVMYVQMIRDTGKHGRAPDMLDDK